MGAAHLTVILAADTAAHARGWFELGIAAFTFAGLMWGVVKYVRPALTALQKVGTLADKIGVIVADYFEVPARIEHGITVDEGRPGIPGQIRQLQNGLSALHGDLSSLREAVNEASRVMELLAHVPEQLAENRKAIEEQLVGALGVVNETRRLAAAAATTAARVEEQTAARVENLEDLIGAQAVALRHENQELRATLQSTLHELGLMQRTTLPRPPNGGTE